MKVLVFGGAGHFGGRICRRLARFPAIEVIAPSRSDLDIRSPTLAATLRDTGADVVVHTAGPYQGQDYTVARACIDAACHYVDLADGRDFVGNFSTLDADAKAAGVTLICGASTLPGISSSVVEAARPKFQSIDRVEISIAPAHQTPRGIGTVSSVLSYCGQPFTSLRDGRWDTVYGWQDLRVQRYPGFRARLSAVCDVPDLELIPAHVAELQTATFHAALEAPWEHLILWLMAWLSRLRLVRGWVRLAPFIAAVSDRLIRLGSDCGGMHIFIAGCGFRKEKMHMDWYLLSGSNHGPEIPCTPSIVMTKKLLNEEMSEHGAFVCWNLFSAEELMRELDEYDVRICEEECVD